VFALTEHRDGPHDTGLEVDRGKPERRRLERRQIRREALGHEDHGSSVGRERRLEVGERVAREPVELAGVDPVAVEVEQPAGAAGKTTVWPSGANTG
jgi:hypothetical protein